MMKTHQDSTHLQHNLDWREAQLRNYWDTALKPLYELGKAQDAVDEQAQANIYPAKVKLYSHAISEPNPGATTYSWLAKDEHGRVLAKDTGLVHLFTTNQVGSYEAIIRGLLWAHSKGLREVLVRSSSQVVIKQITGQMGCYSDRLQLLLKRIERAKVLMSLAFEWVPIEDNQEADNLARYAYHQATGNVAPRRVNLKRQRRAARNG